MYRNTAGRGIGIAGIAALVLGLSTPGAAQTAQPTKPAAQAGQAAEKMTAAPAQPAQAARQARPLRQDRRGGLRLSDEQQTRMKALRKLQQAERKTAGEALKAARQTLNEAQRAEAFDEKSLRAAAAAFAAAQTDATVLRARHRSQHLALLTPDQREQAMARRKAGARAERQVRTFQARQMRAWRMGQHMGMGGGRGLGRQMGMDQWFMGQGRMGRRMMTPGRRPWWGPGQPPPEGQAAEPVPPTAPKKKI